jgi:hypothetical protein
MIALTSVRQAVRDASLTARLVCACALTVGEGVPLHVEVANADQAQRGVHFGAVPCGSSSTRALALANRGRADTAVSFGPSAEMLQRLGIEVMPAGGVVLKPRQTAQLTLLYRWVAIVACATSLLARCGH